VWINSKAVIGYCRQNLPRIGHFLFECNDLGKKIALQNFLSGLQTVTLSAFIQAAITPAGPIVKAHLEELISQSLMHLKRDDTIPEIPDVALSLERTRNPEHGDYACNIAMTLAKAAKKPPRELAEAVINKLPPSRHVQKVEIAGPGFINFYLSRHCQLNVIKDILAGGDLFGSAPVSRDERITVEFVSANPTGPLHVGHGRGAAYGASLANILEAAGYTVQREYYVNDNGRQMDILASSVWIRYLELCGERVRTFMTSPASSVLNKAIRCASVVSMCLMACQKMNTKAATRKNTSTP
jgi:arginyl-tRNA synthetase